MKQGKGDLKHEQKHTLTPNSSSGLFLEDLKLISHQSTHFSNSKANII